MLCKYFTEEEIYCGIATVEEDNVFNVIFSFYTAIILFMANKVLHLKLAT